MFRRTGYILGLLFVLACVAAYPLTWGRWIRCAYFTEHRFAFAVVLGGQLRLGYNRPTHLPPELPPGFYADSEPIAGARGRLYTVGSGTLDGVGGGIVVFFPLWLPALVASLFMAWRWRRRRTRRGAGFPVDQVSG
jgi:hypothetical protein